MINNFDFNDKYVSFTNMLLSIIISGILLDDSNTIDTDMLEENNNKYCIISIIKGTNKLRKKNI